MVLSRFYSPHNDALAPTGVGMAAFMFNPEELNHQASQYYLADRRHQTTPEVTIPQQNEVDSPQTPENPFAIESTEIADPLPTEKTDDTTTDKTTALPELAEPKIEEEQEHKETKEIEPVPKKRVTKKKQERKPAEDEDEDEEEEYSPKMPSGAFFPMFFGWGRGRSSGTPGAVAIANAFSTGRGAVASSHATAYGLPPPESKLH